MEYIAIIISIVVIIIFKFIFGVTLKNIKKIKEIGYDKHLNEITNIFPENKKVCEEILKKLGNNNTKINLEENKNLTYYSVISDTITIANISDTFTRIQTIAHECLHSKQNRKILLFNFIFSNIYLLYFIIVVILTIINVIKEPMIQIFIISILGFIYYAIRGYLETDAMTKAPYIAKEYMLNYKKLSEENLKIIMENYEKMNEIGIPMTNFKLISSVFIKIIIYCIILIICI